MPGTVKINTARTVITGPLTGGLRPLQNSALLAHNPAFQAWSRARPAQVVLRRRSPSSLPGRPKNDSRPSGTMQPVCRCPEDGFYEGESCPICGRTGEVVVPADRRRRLSKFLSGALRHFPDDVGIELDTAGWAKRNALIEGTGRRYEWFDPVMLPAIVATDPKGRFEIDGNRIRATYGHSVDVSLETADAPVPDELFHGTAPSNVDPILKEGLQPMGRQLVHLSDSRREARKVGERHADEPVVLRVDAAGLQADGWEVTKRGAHVFTVDRVPPAFLSVHD